MTEPVRVNVKDVKEKVGYRDVSESKNYSVSSLSSIPFVYGNFFFLLLFTWREIFFKSPKRTCKCSLVHFLGLRKQSEEKMGFVRMYINDKK